MKCYDNRNFQWDVVTGDANTGSHQGDQDQGEGRGSLWDPSCSREAVVLSSSSSSEAQELASSALCRSGLSNILVLCFSISRFQDAFACGRNEPLLPAWRNKH